MPVAQEEDAGDSDVASEPAPQQDQAAGAQDQAAGAQDQAAGAQDQAAGAQDQAADGDTGGAAPEDAAADGQAAGPEKQQAQPTIAIVSPSSGSQFPAGSGVTVEFECTGDAEFQASLSVVDENGQAVSGSGANVKLDENGAGAGAISVGGLGAGKYTLTLSGQSGGVAVATPMTIEIEMVGAAASEEAAAPASVEGGGADGGGGDDNPAQAPGGADASIAQAQSEQGLDATGDLTPTDVDALDGEHGGGGSGSGGADQGTQAAVAQAQQDQGLPSSGELTPSDADALESQHGDGGGGGDAAAAPRQIGGDMEAAPDEESADDADAQAPEAAGSAAGALTGEKPEEEQALDDGAADGGAAAATASDDADADADAQKEQQPLLLSAKFLSRTAPKAAIELTASKPGTVVHAMILDDAKGGVAATTTMDLSDAGMGVWLADLAPGVYTIMVKGKNDWGNAAPVVETFKIEPDPNQAGNEESPSGSTGGAPDQGGGPGPGKATPTMMVASPSAGAQWPCRSSIPVEYYCEGTDQFEGHVDLLDASGRRIFSSKQQFPLENGRGHRVVPIPMHNHPPGSYQIAVYGESGGVPTSETLISVETVDDTQNEEAPHRGGLEEADGDDGDEASP